MEWRDQNGYLKFCLLSSSRLVYARIAVDLLVPAHWFMIFLLAADLSRSATVSVSLGRPLFLAYSWARVPPQSAPLLFPRMVRS